LKHLQGSFVVPKLYWAGTEGDYKVMVTELLGPSLESLFGICHKKFSLGTVLSLAEQLVINIKP
jgi:hypothetical protein